MRPGREMETFRPGSVGFDEKSSSFDHVRMSPLRGRTKTRPGPEAVHPPERLPGCDGRADHRANHFAGDH